MNRSVTPPSQSLLTPPPTGGFGKSVKFLDDDLTDTIARRLSKFEEGESPAAFFEEIEEGSDVEIEWSEEEPISSIDDSPLPSPTTDISSASEISIKDLLAPETATVAPPAIADPFPLLRLPFSLRTKVYDYLLVVPGLICVRQNQTTLEEVDEGHLHAGSRQLVPGIDHAFAQLTVNGSKLPFSRFATININILLASKDVHGEAKAVLFGRNNFEIVRPSPELNPPVDYSVRLFPPGCQRLVTKLNIRIRSFYDLHWLLSSGYNDIKNFYRGLHSLTLILEIDSVKKGFGRQWARRDNEKWQVYVMRLQIEIANCAYAFRKGNNMKVMPDWIGLRILFGGESYDEKLKAAVSTTTGMAAEQTKRDELRAGLVETWELFKRGGH